MKIVPVSLSHSLYSVPPRSSMAAFRFDSPNFAAAARTAQEPVPQASISPLPRYQTRMRSRPGESTLTNSTLTP